MAENDASPSLKEKSNSHINGSLKSMAGLSLVETVVALGLLGVISAGALTLFKMMQSNQLLVDTKHEESEIRRTITTILANSENCTATLASHNLGAAVTSISSITTANIFEVGKNYGNGSIEIIAMKTEDTGTALGADRKLINFKIDIKRLRPADAIQPRPLLVQLVAKVSPTDAIENCMADGGSVAETICNSITGATWEAATMSCRGLLPLAGGDLTGPVTSTDSITVSNTVSANSFLYTSDGNLKTNVQQIDDPLRTVMSIRGVKFVWKDTGTADYGFIAQEIAKDIPELVVERESDHRLSVDYAKLVPFLVGAVQQQQKEIEALKSQNKSRE